ncbi:hypothetical protein KTJ53_15700 [Acinetobacter variabilis]|uniref:hypothetical protein n=1 Tax=Acinetobacter variabilis TaxID=70346 RepID=UPI0021CF6BE9|nr:hypothetical protein [Acinetobacter variabilis]MCU4631082.1 hypothetical protein [Acinetobacter variabilis]
MSYDLDKVIRFGQKIGAEVAIIMNGELRNYYKKGNKDTKYCCLTYTNHNNGRPLRWESANEYSWDRIIDFYRSLSYAVEIIDIPEHEKKPEP